MHFIAQRLVGARQIILLGLGGMSLEVLENLAAQGVMQNLARRLPRFSKATLGQPYFLSPASSWATLETGSPLSEHGVLDDIYFDRRRRCLVSCLKSSSPAAPFLWLRKPTSERELEAGVCRTIEGLQEFFDQLQAGHFVSSSNEQGVSLLKLTVLDSLFLRLWNYLGVVEEPGSRKNWIERTQTIFRTLDELLEAFFVRAAMQETAVALAGPYRFVPFREKIVLNELLRGTGLLYRSEGRTRFHYECSHFFEKQKRRWGFDPLKEISLSGLLPIDWRRSRAFGLHGENAAFIYLNTPERFGRGTLSTPRQRDDTTAEVLAVLRDVRHPQSGERLFREAFSTVERFGVDPIERQWPEAIGIPEPGYLIRQRFDPAGQLVRPDPSVSGSRSGEGFLMWDPADKIIKEDNVLDLSEPI